jgi:hypothetical protein
MPSYRTLALVFSNLKRPNFVFLLLNSAASVMLDGRTLLLPLLGFSTATKHNITSGVLGITISAKLSWLHSGWQLKQENMQNICHLFFTVTLWVVPWHTLRRFSDEINLAGAKRNNLVALGHFSWACRGWRSRVNFFFGFLGNWISCFRLIILCVCAESPFYTVAAWKRGAVRCVEFLATLEEQS